VREPKSLPRETKYVDFTLVYMIAYIPTGIAIGTGQCELPLFLREKLRRFWSIWQESQSDET
jgi:hypothetical protein